MIPPMIVTPSRSVTSRILRIIFKLKRIIIVAVFQLLRDIICSLLGLLFPRGQFGFLFLIDDLTRNELQIQQKQNPTHTSSDASWKCCNVFASGKVWLANTQQQNSLLSVDLKIDNKISPKATLQRLLKSHLNTKIFNQPLPEQ